MLQHVDRLLTPGERFSCLAMRAGVAVSRREREALEAKVATILRGEGVELGRQHLGS
jgi:hypothetical protein